MSEEIINRFGWSIDRINGLDQAAYLVANRVYICNLDNIVIVMVI